MSTNTHAFTPGPWSVNDHTNLTEADKDADRSLGIYADGDVGRNGSFVAVIEGDVFDPEEQAANARLIAAAPDLLEALFKVIDQGFKSDTTGYWHLDPKVIPVIDAAIAKATGKDSA